MFNKFMKFLVPKLEEWCLRKGRLLLISGRDDPENTYLRRMFLFRSKWLSIYIHRFMRSDNDTHHDHPFAFLGYVVSGRYKESLMTEGYRPNEEVRGIFPELEALKDVILCPTFEDSYRNEGTFGYRKAEAIHRVEIDRSYTNDEYKKAPLTIIFRGPYITTWGFWVKTENPNIIKKIFWREYLGVPEDDVRE